MTKEKAVWEQRQRVGTTVEEGVAGDLVVGRHAWKEYIRGVHEGWLGPVVQPAVVVEEVKEETTHVDGSPSLGDAAVKAAAEIATTGTDGQQSSSSDNTTTTDDASLTTTTTTPPPAPEDEKPKPKNQKPPAYIPTSSYTTSSPPASFPQLLGPTTPILFPHLLGFWNFPIRIYRFLNRRQVAEQVSRATAAAVLGAHREFRDEDVAALEHEETEWHKSVKKTEAEEQEKKERVWIDGVVVDERITSRLRVFELDETRE